MVPSWWLSFACAPTDSLLTRLLYLFFRYNACLAIYYLMVLRYQESESSSTDVEHFLWNVERLFHATAWSFGLVPALKAMHWKLYAATPTGCWIASPQQCDDDDDDNLDCDVRDEAWQFR